MFEKLIITEYVSALEVFDKKAHTVSFISRYADAIIIPKCGRLKFTTHCGSYIVSRSSPIFLPQGLAYRNDCLEAADSFVFNFHSENSPSVPLTLPELPLQQAAEIFDLTVGADSRFERLSVLYRLFALICNAGKAVNGTAAEALAYIRTHYSDPTLCVGNVASACLISEAYLYKLTKAAFGESPSALISKVRLERAHALLAEKRSVGECALAVGYSDLPQFSRAYKRKYGTAPSRCIK